MGTALAGALHLRRARMRWKVPALPGYMVCVSAKIDTTYVENGERRIDIALTVTDQNDAVSVTGWTTFVVPQERK